jgi:hypothetical protein
MWPKLFKYFKRSKKSIPDEKVEDTAAHGEFFDGADFSTKNSRSVMENTNVIPPEFVYLEKLISYRLGLGHHPEFPDVKHWSLPVKKYVVDNGLDADAATLLLIGLVPHAFPELFDQAIQEKIKASGDFPEIGGIRGKNFRGFLPTGQTAIFLLAGHDWKRRSKVEQLFWSDGEFAMKKILWLEELPQGEPIMSGKITMALDHVNLFLYGSSAPPHFSTSFPAKKITTKLTTREIMMNKEVKRHYKLLKDWFEHNPALMKDWGMDKLLRQGFRVLFYGPPGTGKTLTAKVLGHETGKDVYKIDLSMVVSKYIGETEKNLEMIFARAEQKDWILFFDEADAIFGKRTNVRDAHDKYANQEVSYLLQRIEDFNGLIILATNMKANIDQSFIRRFDDIVKFSIPSEEERKEIWEKSFPKDADYDNIPDQIKKYELTGGNIINVVHFAGIQAVRRREELLKAERAFSTPCGDDWVDSEPHQETSEKLKFYMDDIIEGIRKEMIKEGKPFTG